MQKAIIVYEVFKNGAAAKDGRLRPGDQLLEVSKVVALSSFLTNLRIKIRAIWLICVIICV